MTVWCLKGGGGWVKVGDGKRGINNNGKIQKNKLLKIKINEHFKIAFSVASECTIVITIINITATYI